MQQPERERAGFSVRRRHVGMRRRIFYMYCAVIAAILLALIPICRQTLAISYEKTYNSYEALMSTGLAQAEAEIVNTLNTLYAVKSNESFQKLAYLDDEGVQGSYYLSYEVLSQLKALSLQKNVVRDFELFFSKSAIHFTSRRVFSSLAEYYGSFFSLNELSIEAYAEMQRQATSSTKVIFYPARQAQLLDEGAVELILYYVPFSLTGGLFSRACGAYFYLDAQRLRQAADPQALGGAHILADAEGRLLYADGCTQEEALRLIEDEERTGSLQGAQMDLYVYRGAELGLTYYWCISSKQYPGNHYLTLGVLFLYATLAAALGLFLAALMTRMQYAPIQKLKDVVGRPEDAPDSDEYAAFANAYLAVQKNNSTYRERIQELNALLEANLFEKLLWHAGDVEAAADWFENHKPSMLASGFRLVEVCVHLLYPEGRAENAEETGESNEVAIISAILSELLPKYWEAETFVHPISSDHLVFLIPDTDGERQVIRDKLSNIRQYICRAFEVDVMFSVSPRYQEIREIHMAFEQTQDMLQKLNEPTEPPVQGAVFFTEELRRQRGGSLFNQHTMERLCNPIGAGSAEAARQLMRDLASSCPHDHENRMQLFYNLRSTIEFKYSELENVRKSDEELELPSFYGGMASDEAFERLEASCEKLCALYTQAFPNGTFSAKERILEYIADNYADPELYGKQIASKFDLSEKYLYTYFKKQMGVGFSDYLEDLRLHRATELLASSRMSISEIAAKVGFNSHNTFYKAFKRKYGITPSEYRNTNASSEAQAEE